jgi:alpha-beta hydrolase superfamily lysophospholipase
MTELRTFEDRWTPPGSSRSIAYRMWYPEQVQGAVLLLHGFGEHGGRYDAMGRALAARGLGLAVPDLWGHGRSGGRRGEIEDLPAMVDALHGLLREVLLPVLGGSEEYALIGHSFGGLLALQWALARRAGLRRLVLLSPLLEVGFPIPAWKSAAAAVCGVCAPRARLTLGLDVRALSHDEAVVHAYKRDPLVHNLMTAGTYRSLLRTRARAVRDAEALETPVLLAYGGADRIISTRVAQQWFDRVRCPKQVHRFDGAFHELHHEPVREELYGLIEAWIRAS